MRGVFVLRGIFMQGYHGWWFGFSREISNLEYGGSVEERGGQHWECIYGQGEGEKYYPNQFILARQYHKKFRLH